MSQLVTLHIGLPTGGMKVPSNVSKAKVEDVDTKKKMSTISRDFSETDKRGRSTILIYKAELAKFPRRQKCRKAVF